MQLNEQQVWEITLPAKENQKYQYIIKTQNNEIFTKIDPFSFKIKDNYSIITDLKKLKNKSSKISINNSLYNSPLNIYEIYIGGWNRNYKTYRELAEPLTQYLKNYNFNAVQFMPIMEYPKFSTWGYQTMGYFAPTNRYGNPEDLIYLIDYLHQNNIYVFLDWTPAHFDPHPMGLINFDGNQLYEYPEQIFTTHPIWKTQLFNWGNPYVESFLISSANFWLSIYDFDGLRIDTITTLIQLFTLNENKEVTQVKYNPSGIDFCCKLTRALKAQHENTILIAEETQGFWGITNPNEYNFSYKQSLGWSWDTGSFIYKPKENFHGLIKPLEYLYMNRGILTYGHDQIAKQNGFLCKQFHESFDQLRTFYSYMISFPGKKCLFMGNEYGQSGYWDYTQPLTFITKTDEKDMSQFTQSINQLYLNTPEFYEWDYTPEGIQVMHNNYNGQVLCFMRHCSKGSIMCLFNFSNIDYYDYKIDNYNQYSKINQIFTSKYMYDSNAQIKNNQLSFNLPAHSAFFYKVKN